MNCELCGGEDREMRETVVRRRNGSIQGMRVCADPAECTSLDAPPLDAPEDYLQGMAVRCELCRKRLEDNEIGFMYLNNMPLWVCADPSGCLAQNRPDCEPRETVPPADPEPAPRRRWWALGAKR